MNFLAHAMLAGGQAGYLVGGMVGDFVKGPVDARDVTALADGIRLHRAIDRFTDEHPVCRRARNRFPAAHRRVAGIVTDMMFDHYLARDWERYQPHETLETFVDGVYRTLEAHTPDLPAAFVTVLPRMREADWLGSYRDLAATVRAIGGIARRMRRAGPLLLRARDDVRPLYAALGLDFAEFFPQLMAFAKAWRESRSGSPHPVQAGKTPARVPRAAAGCESPVRMGVAEGAVEGPRR